MRDRCLHEALLPLLAAQGVRLVRMSELSPSEWMRVDEFFESQVFPILTPLAVDPGHPFPYISNLSLSLAVELRDPGPAGRALRAREGAALAAALGADRHREPASCRSRRSSARTSSALFPGMEVLRWFAFRITRYSRSRPRARSTRSRTCSTRSSSRCSAAASARWCVSRCRRACRRAAPAAARGAERRRDAERQRARRRTTCTRAGGCWSSATSWR